LHSNSETPHKASKTKPLTALQKHANKTLSQARVLNENVIGKVKIFRCIAEKYRSHKTNRFSLRFNLIAAIYNLNLQF
jgi:DDE superfamily endonuclease